jgi:D-sedoheptulose 7-phosphate isomerase
MTEFVRAQIAGTMAVFTLFANDDSLISSVAEVGRLCADALANGGKIMLAGNGGSAADSQHIAAEFVGRLTANRCPLPALALTTDTSILTAAANDYGYDSVFERQIIALGRPGDVFIGISTSGNSPNILRAVEAARGRQVTAVALTGETGGQLQGLCDHIVRVPSRCTQNIQEVHIMIGHIVCAIAEQAFLSAKPEAVEAFRWSDVQRRSNRIHSARSQFIER